MPKIQAQIESVLANLRPFLQEDGGDIQFHSFNKETGIVSVELHGACVGCPLAGVTLHAGVEQSLMNEIPEVKGVEAVN